MPSSRHSSRIDSLELKVRIIKKVGHQKAERYFYYLNRLLSLKLSKSEFNKLCISTIGRENVSLHNQFIGSIIKNACLAKTPPPKGSKIEGSLNAKIANGYRSSNFQSLSGGDVIPPSPRKGRSSNLRDCKFKDRPSPLGPHGKTQSIIFDESVPKAQEQQSATELFSLGSRPPAEVFSVEDGEEVEQITGSPTVQSRSPVRAPFGIPMNNTGFARKSLRSSSLTAVHPETCHNSYELPDSRTLKKILERKLENEGLGVSVDCVNLLNNGLDAYLKRLIKPCMELARSRHANEQSKQVNYQVMQGYNGVWPNRYMQRPTQSISASLLDFRVAMELNPQLLGEDWSVQLERVCLHTPED
ncbi:Transcriptional coactivator Hfi1/Transcriptional adapter 1 [Macleaya cordata]|uniref:Transcriptional coactivator Hfi1/Transcriptional adapter 1 n=1 Tax=Macleaya cordata TaxID=56857 RepID=A0A200QFT8_MACCD|nr:Transcriptional coactivator Hfi1/Transcriptional adapter 1 [Macleaya cordata]